MKDDRFRNHHDFIFAVYNHLQRQKVREATKFQLTGYPGGTITPEILYEQMQRLQQHLPLNNTAVSSLMNKVRTAGALIEHSPQRKTLLRSNLFGLIATFGWPTFFVTLNPSDLTSPIVRLQKIPHQEFDELVELLQKRGPLSPEEFQKSTEFIDAQNGNDPVLCALYYRHVVTSFERHILGYDSVSRTYQRGMFGQLLAHFGCTEEQQRKSLHLHLLLWTKDLTDYEKFQENLKEEEYKNECFSYLEQVISENQMETPYTTGDPTSYLCPWITTELDGREVGWVQQKVQRHICSKYHCMKKQKQCRYKFPKETIVETHYNTRTKKIQIQRNNGWMNSCIPAIAAIGRFNTDVVFIPGKAKAKEARYIAWYATNYTSKVEATAVQLLSFMKKKAEELSQFEPESLTNNTAARKILSKTLN